MLFLGYPAPYEVEFHLYFRQSLFWKKSTKIKEGTLKSTPHNMLHVIDSSQKVMIRASERLVTQERLNVDISV